MKAKLLVGLIGACFGAPVLAQSNITIYGIADAGIQVSSFGKGTQTNVASGIADGSRVGFKGVEDLGGGYRTVFTLETRFELDTGALGAGYLATPSANVPLTNGLPAAVATVLGPTILGTRINSGNALFDRQAYVGMVTPVGTFLLGRQYTPGYEIVAKIDTFEAGTGGTLLTSLFTGTGGFLTPGAAARANQALQYRFQSPSGIGGAAMIGLSGGATTGSLGLSKRFWGTSVTYKANGFDVGVGYNTETDQNGNKSLTTTTVGGSYAMGDTKLFAGYHRMKNDNPTLVPLLTPVIGAANAGVLSENAKLNGDIYTVGMQYRIGAGRILGVLGFNNDKKASNSDATLFAVGYDHDLSKRTDLYATLAHVTNKNGSQRTPGAAGYYSGFSSDPGRSANVLQVGMRHKF
ncbi:porin [soil metagenome]